MNLQLVYRYILSLSKNDIYFENKTKEKDQFQGRESNPGPLTCKVNTLSNVPWQLTLSIFIKIIMLNTFAYEILPVDAVWSR